MNRIAGRNRCSIPFVSAWALTCIGAACGVFSGAAHASDDGAVQVGFAGYVKVGRWAQVTCRKAKPLGDRANAETVDPKGRTVRYALTSESAGDGKAVFRGFCKFGRIDASLRIRSPEASSPANVVDAGTGLRPPLKQSALLVATLGNPGGFNQLAESDDDDNDESNSSRKTFARPTSLHDGIHVVELGSPTQLPVASLGYDALDVLVISGKYELDDRRSRALQRWIRDGGHLIFCRGSELGEFQARGARDLSVPEAAGGVPSPKQDQKAPPGTKISKEHISQWLPITILGQSRLSDLGGIETFAARKTTIIFSGRVRAAHILDPSKTTFGGGTVLATGFDGPLFVRVAYGFGRITFCGLDFHRPPLSNWREIGAIARRLIREAHPNIAATRRVSANRRLAQSGITDLGTQLNTIQQEFPQIHTASAWGTMGWLLIYVLLIGPIDYLLVHRLLKRPRLTWVTFPVMIVGASFLALWDTEPLGEQRVRLNQFEIVDVDVTAKQQSLRVNSWLTLYSPESRRYRLSLASAELTDLAARSKPQADNSTNRYSARLAWNGTTENVFGGMYRTTGISFDRLNYDIAPTTASLGDLPVRIRSTASLTGSSRHDAGTLVDCRLAASPIGELSGTITHHLGTPIEDWILVYGSRIYLPTSDATRKIAAGTAWSLSQREITTADLRSTLTGVRLTNEEKSDSTGTREISEQTDYDPQSRDRQQLVRIISFHELAGGKGYTGLDNYALAKLELTGLMHLQRAVLIGRVQSPATRLLRQTDNSSDEKIEIEPQQRHTFLRIVLPVRQPKLESAPINGNVNTLPTSNPQPAGKRKQNLKPESKPAPNPKTKPPVRAKPPRRESETGLIDPADTSLPFSGVAAGDSQLNRQRSVVRT